MSKTLKYVEHRSTPLTEEEKEIQELLMDDIKDNADLDKRSKAVGTYGAFAHATRLLREHGVVEEEWQEDENYEEDPEFED